jgi:ABC-type sugar transport system permease subunit
MALRHVRPTALGYTVLAPSLFGVVTFMLLPMLVVLWLSLHRWDLLGRFGMSDRTIGNRCSPIDRSGCRWW